MSAILEVDHVSKRFAIGRVLSRSYVDAVIDASFTIEDGQPEDLATAYYISSRIVIMQKGHIVEMGPARAILEAREHPYARLLKNSVLSIDEAGYGKVQSPGRSLTQAAAKQSGSGMLVEGSGQKVRVTK